jgi:pyridoxal/pyridoxine/pyridoxamine kinase
MITIHQGTPEHYQSSSQLPSAAAYGLGEAYVDAAVYFSNGAAWVKLTDANDVATDTVLTGFVSGAGTVAATDTCLEAIQKLDGNIAAKADPVAAADGDFYVAITSEGAATTKLTFTNGILTAITPPA